MTHRAVAMRAEANPGLVHYYFQGTAGQNWSRGSACVAGIGVFLEAARHPAQGRLVTEVASAAVGDPEIGLVVRAELARARCKLNGWLGKRHPTWLPG